MQTVFHVFNFLDVHFNLELAYYDVLFEMLRVNSFERCSIPFRYCPFLYIVNSVIFNETARMMVLLLAFPYFMNIEHI